MRTSSVLCLVTAFLSPALTYANAVVDSVQPPAWVERNNNRIAISPGMSLTTADQLNTGGGGKVLLKLSEGSNVKLGENVGLEIEQLDPTVTEDDTSVFKAVLNVLKGAFRFTTTELGKNRMRDLQIQVGTATIGIRGTDVWGKASSANDFVVLLEGKIELARHKAQTVVMDKPLTIYDAPRDSEAKPVEAVDMDKLAVWAQETELDSGKGVITGDGRHRVYLASYQSELLADEAIQKFHRLGYAVEKESVNIDGRNWYRLAVNRFASMVDAVYFQKMAKRRFDIDGAWVTQM